MKSALNEMKGLSALHNANVEGIFFPLMALIHYRGFTLVASSLVRHHNCHYQNENLLP